MEINTKLPEAPGAVEVELGQFRLIPGPRGETGERGPRGYGVESAVLNPDFTLTIKFEDGSSYTTASIRGATGETGPRGERGPQGERGPEGPAGPGSGDMLAATYDLDGKATDIFKYAEEKAAEAVRDVSAENVRFGDGETFQQKLDSGELKGETGPAGPRGADGAAGAIGPQGPAGPNTVSTDTATDLDGLLKGGAGKMAAAVAGEDYVTPEGLDAAIRQAVRDTWEASY